MKFVEQLHAHDRLHQFLISLDSDYGHVHPMIFSHNLLPSMTRAYQQVAREELLRSFLASSLPDPNVMVAFKVESKGKSNAFTWDLIYTHYSRKGHEVVVVFIWWATTSGGGDRP